MPVDAPGRAVPGPVVDPAVIHPPVADPASGPTASPVDAVLDAALGCSARWGITKSSLEEIAREAGISRATLYRLFPGGKPALLQAVAEREVQRVLGLVRAEIRRHDDLEGALAGAIAAAASFVATHGTLQYLMQHERQVLLPFISFDHVEPLLSLAAVTLSPELHRFVDAQLATELVEWATRLTISLVLAPGALDPTDAAAMAAFVHRYLTPGLPAAVST